MRSILTFLALLIAAAVGGYAAHYRAHDSAPAVSMAVAPAHAALPAVVGGAPLPSLAPMLERVTPAVVNVYSTQRVAVRNPLADDPFLRRFLGLRDMPRERIARSLGSGVVVDAAQGLVLTNNHVIEGADSVSVTLADGRSLDAEFVGSDPDTDVALIRIPADDLTALPLADTSTLRVGDFVVAVGNPYGLGQAVTSGIVSAVGRSGLQGLGYQNFIQTDASINPGNSGGALVNLAGELVGINTASFNPRGSAAGNIGLGFAIPADLARQVMGQLLEFGEVRRGSLGIETQDISAAIATKLKLGDRHGALVARIYPESPAAAAGLRVGDVIAAVDGRAVASRDALHNVEGLLPVATPVPLEVVRDGRVLTLSATLTAQPSKLAGATLDPRLAGASFAELPERARQQGYATVVVTRVEADSRAARNGLRPQMEVLGVNGEAVDGIAAFQAQLARQPSTLVLTLMQGPAKGELLMR